MAAVGPVDFPPHISTRTRYDLSDLFKNIKSVFQLSEEQLNTASSELNRMGTKLVNSKETYRITPLKSLELHVVNYENKSSNNLEVYLETSEEDSEDLPLEFTAERIQAHRVIVERLKDTVDAYSHLSWTFKTVDDFSQSTFNPKVTLRKRWDLSGLLIRANFSDEKIKMAFEVLIQTQAKAENETPLPGGYEVHLVTIPNKDQILYLEGCGERPVKKDPCPFCPKKDTQLKGCLTFVFLSNQVKALISPKEHQRHAFENPNAEKFLHVFHAHRDVVKNFLQAPESVTRLRGHVGKEGHQLGLDHEHWHNDKRLTHERRSYGYLN